MESFIFYLCIISLCAFVFSVLFASTFVQSTEPTGNFKTLNQWYYHHHHHHHHHYYFFQNNFNLI